MANLPTISVPPQRTVHEDGIVRDAIRQPLFSSAGYNNAALPPSVDFFNYQRGQLVPGAGNAAGTPAKIHHTNMDTSGLLGKPKKFRCDGVSVTMLPIAFTTTANTPELSDPGFSASATANSDVLDDLLLFTYSNFLELRVGEKYYAKHPLWLFPANVGFSGLAALSEDLGSGSAVGHLDITIPHTVGVGLQFAVYPFLVEDQQSLGVSIKCPLVSPPSLVDDRLVTVTLFGNLYREVM